MDRGRRRLRRTCRESRIVGLSKANLFLLPFSEGFNNSGWISSPRIFRSLIIRFRRISFSDEDKLPLVSSVMDERSYTWGGKNVALNDVGLGLWSECERGSGELEWRACSSVWVKCKEKRKSCSTSPSAFSSEIENVLEEGGDCEPVGMRGSDGRGRGVGRRIYDLETRRSTSSAVLDGTSFDLLSFCGTWFVSKEPDERYIVRQVMEGEGARLVSEQVEGVES